MALTDENGGGMNTTMLVGPAGGMGYPVYQGGNGAGFDQGNGWWIILLFILLASGNWGNQNGQNGGMFGTAPIVVNDGNCNGVQRGFDQAAVMGGINGIQAAVTGGFADVQNALCNGFAQAEIAANGRQMANMNQAFGMQTAMSQGFNGLQSQLAQCCCENRLASADLKYTVATENCADRTQAMQNTRDIIDAINNRAQGIENKLCQLELDGVKNQLAQAQRENVGLQNQLNMANLAASQTAQNATIRDSIIGELRSCPIPSQPVYGNQPIFSYPQNNCCGCGCNT